MALSFCVYDINQKLHATWICLLNDKEALIGIKILYFMFKNAHSSSLEIPLDLHIPVQNENLIFMYHTLYRISEGILVGFGYCLNLTND